MMEKLGASRILQNKMILTVELNHYGHLWSQQPGRFTSSRVNLTQTLSMLT